MPTESGSTSPTPQSNSNAERNGGSKLSATSTYDPTPYVQRARVTRPAPPKPSVNPLQFVQIKPCSLYQSAQEQLKKADEVKKVKEIKKEEPEDWQSNLDNWKSSRRKRVEHIIDRVVEVKKLELEEHDRTRRKSKTFSEMLEERGPARRKLSTLAVYTEDESNDLSDLGIGTSSASGKSSLSEDCDNQSVMSDNIDTEKPAYDIDNNSNHRNCGSSRDYISSPGYDTSTSTAPASSPDPCEYTYEGAIQDYKTRVSRAQSGYYNNNCLRSTVSSPFSKDSTPERSTTETFTARRTSGSKIEDRLINFEIKCTTENPSENINPKKDLPKVDILKRRELFEKDSTASTDVSNQKRFSGDFSSSKSIRDRLTSLEKRNDETKKQNRLSGDITSIKDRLQHLEKQPPTPAEKPPKIDVPVVSLKDRLTSLQSAASKEEIKKPVALVDEHDLEVLRREELEKQNTLKRDTFDDENINSSQEILNIQDESNADTDREDSGIHTTDVSCSVSQTDEQPELVNEETHHHINEDGLCTNPMGQAEEEVVCITTTVPDLVQDSSVEKTKLSGKRRSVETELSEDLQLSPGGSPEPPVDQEASVNEALELALQAIDGESFTNNFQINEPQPTIDSVEKCEKSSSAQISTVKSDSIYENLKEDYSQDTHLEEPSEPAPITQTITEITNPSEDEEPYYQVPKSSEPYYEVPKHTKPVPVYENVEIFYSGPASNNGLSMGSSVLEPPKEKPPPPPVGELTDDEEGKDDLYEPIKQRSAKTKSKQDPAIIDVSKDINNRPIKRMNSTKRIKKELRNKRSSFLGLEGSNDDDSFLELTIAPPPDMAQLLQEEKRLEKQLYMKAGLYDSSDTGDSRDSGVSENHSRQSSEPFTTSSEEHEDLLGKKEKEIIEVLEKEEERRRSNENWNGVSDNDSKIQKIEYQIREQEEVLRVERELLQLEQEELKRQRENLIIRENMARRELEHGAKMLMSANRHSLLDINTSTNHYANVPNQIYQVEADYRKSMSDLQEDFNQKRAPPPAPPAKPLRTHQSVDGRQSSGLVKIAHHARLQHSQSTDDFAPTRNYQPVSAIHHGNMTRHTLHALSATPKPKFTDGWVHSRTVVEKTNESWLSYQQKRKSVPEGFNYNKHWLIQEAEQRRLDQQRGLRSSALNGWGSSNAIQRNGIADNKPLPDAVIQTLTQRVQSKGIGERKKLETSSSESTISTTPTSTPSMNTIPMNSTLPEGQQDKILSVSGKKKCSHCGEELGRGAAMIIESLRLFYHINCFKCCVCHVQLGDGLNGTDVRVRNHKLHCHNCYSSDDGIKFSCV